MLPKLNCKTYALIGISIAAISLIGYGIYKPKRNHQLKLIRVMLKEIGSYQDQN